jgi:hypothetical protein
VALSRGSPRVGVTDHPALWSPDLPHRARRPGATARPTHPLTAYSRQARRDPACGGKPYGLRATPAHAMERITP